MATEPMASVDAAWLHMDEPSNRMIVNCVFLFDGPMDWRRLAAVLEERLVRPFPRFRQRVEDPRVTVGYLSGPVWVDDEAFDIGRHLHRAKLSRGSARTAVARYVGERLSTPLSLDRPLWEAHLLETQGGDGAVLLRTHHAIADGTALMHVLLTLRDPAEGHVELPARAVKPGAGAATGIPIVDRLVDASATATTRAFHMADAAARGYRTALRNPRHLLEVAGSLRANAAMLRKLGFGLPDDHTALFGRLGTAKQVCWSQPMDLDVVKTSGRSLGATVNDVMLGLIAGGLRRYFEERRLPVEDVVISVPYNVRGAEEVVTPTLGNRFGLVFVRLPVTIPDAAGRIAEVKRQMDLIKAGNEGMFVYGVLGTVGRTPTQVQRAWIDMFSGKADAVVTNIAGPREEITVAGTRLRSCVAWVPTTGPVGVGLSIVSYNGSIVVGVAVDTLVVPDSAVLLRALEKELASARVWQRRVATRA